jgi:hypothetical protein
MNTYAAVVVALVAPWFARCEAAELAQWVFVQSVGGIAIGPPLKSSSGWLLPVQCDVSGLKTITTQPTTLNSGIACVETRAVAEGSSIFVTVVTDIAGPGRSASCPAASLGAIAPGHYSVKYRDRDGQAISLGEVTIAL